MFVDTQKRPQGEHVDAIAPSRMKLSAAIRIGARLRPQCSGKFFIDGGSCAMGAAMEAVGIRYQEVIGLPERSSQLFPELFNATGGFTDLATEIYGRNDAGLSRESIADWLESQGL